MAMSGALINANRFNRHFTKSAPKTVIFAITFLFEFYLSSVCFSWVYITPTLYTTISCEHILINYCPIHYFWSTGFRRWTETDLRCVTLIVNGETKTSERNRIQVIQVYILKLKPTCLCQWSRWIFCSFSTETHCPCFVAVGWANWYNPSSKWLLRWSWEVAF